MEDVTMSVGGLIMLCITMCGIGACIAHWADSRWHSDCEDEEACDVDK